MFTNLTYLLLLKNSPAVAAPWAHIADQAVYSIYFMYKYFCTFVFVLCIVSINFIIIIE